MRSPRLWVMLVSFALALLLTILPLPPEWETLRPQWVAMVLLYWNLYFPERIGVFWGWSVGIALDATTESVLGQHALSFSVIAWIAIELHRRIRLFPLVQQSLSVWVLLLIERLLSLWIMGATGTPTPSLVYWVPTLLGLLLWFGFFFLLRDLRHRLGVG